MDRAVLLARGEQQVASGLLQDAAATYRSILANAPRDPVALSNLGAVLNAAKCHEAAEAVCRVALSVQPDYWAALGNLGTALHRQQRHDEAIAAYIAALKVNPTYADGLTNLGVALAERWRMADSLAVHDMAVLVAPEDAEIRCNRAIALLTAGDFARGFAENEWRWRTPAMAPHALGGPLWRGEDPAGKTILLHDEGGYGDTLQFARFAPLLAARGARVLLRIQHPLVRLLARSMPEVTVLSKNDPVPVHDLQCPMVSLPLGFAITVDTVPGTTPYVWAPPEGIAAWRARLGTGKPGLRVGLVWAGASRSHMPQAQAMDSRRSMALKQFAPLAEIPNIRLVSLQMGGGTEVAEAPQGLQLLDPMSEVSDFDDTAALVASLDLIISVDTAVAHLAGALGRPVWVLSRHDACWRWLAGRSDSPWYPTLKLFRQRQPGDWDSVMADVAVALRHRQLENT